MIALGNLHALYMNIIILNDTTLSLPHTLHPVLSNNSRREHLLPCLPNEEPVRPSKTKFYNHECLDRFYYNCYIITDLLTSENVRRWTLYFGNIVIHGFKTHINWENIALYISTKKTESKNVWVFIRKCYRNTVGHA